MEIEGFADGRFGPVRQCFAGILAAQPGTGAAFAAWCDGRLVADLWGGYADLGRRRPWDTDSLVGYGMGALGGSYGGASTAGGYTVGFVTGSVGSHDRVDKLENTLRECLGLAPIPATGHPPPGS